MTPPSGYSGTPLTKKLGIKPSMTVALVNESGSLRSLLAPVPDGVAIRTDLRGRPDVIVMFVDRAAELRRRLPVAGRAIFPDRSVWVAWPKKSSGVATDITEDTVREVCLPSGLVDVKVCAIDDTWSGLKLVWRKEMR